MTQPLNPAAVAVAQKSRDVRLADAPPTTQTQHQNALFLGSQSVHKRWQQLLGLKRWRTLVLIHCIEVNFYTEDRNSQNAHLEAPEHQSEPVGDVHCLYTIYLCPISRSTLEDLNLVKCVVKLECVLLFGKKQDLRSAAA